MRQHTVIFEGHFDPLFLKPLEKRHKKNPFGQDCHLWSDGRVTRDEDPIIACQRIWRERVYAPPGTLFASRGRMYRKYKEMMIDGGIRRRPVEEVSPKDVSDSVLH